MGVEADFILANQNQAQMVLESDNPLEDFNGVYTKGADPLSLGDLLYVFTEEEFDYAILDEFPLILSEGAGEKLVCGVPSRLREAMKAVDKAKISKVVEAWMAAEYFASTGWDEAIARDFLVNMKNLLSAEGADEKELWLAICV